MNQVKLGSAVDGTKGTTGQGEYLFTYMITFASDDTTEVTLNGEIRGLTGLAKFFSKLMAVTFKKARTKDLDTLKKFLESKENQVH